MPNDVSYFKVPGDTNTYAFNDADAESGLAAETERAEAAEQANASAISAEASRAAGVEGTLSNLTTTAKGSLVAAINEVDENTDANTASISSLNSNKANTNNPSLVFGIGDNTGSNPASSTPRVELRRSGNATNGYAFSIVVVGSSNSKVYELVETTGTFALPIYKGNISTMASLYNQAITYGALYFTGTANLWQALTQTSGNFSCYGYATVEGSSVQYTVTNNPGSQTFCGRLSNASTINRLYSYTGVAVVS